MNLLKLLIQVKLMCEVMYRMIIILLNKQVQAVPVNL